MADGQGASPLSDAVSKRAMKSAKHEMELVRRLIAGEEAAFDEFSVVYIPRVYRFASNRLRHDRELVSDIVQTTLCKAIAKLSTFKGKAAFTSWLCAVCKNEIAGHFRKLMRTGKTADLDDIQEVAADVHLDAFGFGPERAAVRQEARDLVHLALDSLPPHYGRVLEWKYLEELPVDEIASRLDLGLKAAESLLTRARTSFRKTYDRLTSEPAHPRGLGRPAGGEVRVVS